MIFIHPHNETWENDKETRLGNPCSAIFVSTLNHSYYLRCLYNERSVQRNFFFWKHKKKIWTPEEAIEISGRSLPQKNIKQHTVSTLAKRIVG